MNLWAEYRISLGISQSELASRIGCRLRSVCEWEHGYKDPTGYYTAMLVYELGIPSDRLVKHFHGRKNWGNGAASTRRRGVICPSLVTKRLKAGMTCERAAELVGVSRRTFYGWEHLHGISTKYVPSLKETFGLKDEDFE